MRGPVRGSAIRMRGEYRGIPSLAELARSCGLQKTAHAAQQTVQETDTRLDMHRIAACRWPVSSLSNRPRKEYGPFDRLTAIFDQSLTRLESSASTICTTYCFSTSPLDLGLGGTRHLRLALLSHTLLHALVRRAGLDTLQPRHGCRRELVSARRVLAEADPRQWEEHHELGSAGRATTIIKEHDPLLGNSQVLRVTSRCQLCHTTVTSEPASRAHEKGMTFL